LRIAQSVSEDEQAAGCNGCKQHAENSPEATCEIRVLVRKSKYWVRFNRLGSTGRTRGGTCSIVNEQGLKRRSIFYTAGITHEV